jgi:hypothetical protein
VAEIKHDGIRIVARKTESTSGCTSALATPDASLSPDSRGHGTTARTHLYCRWRGGWSIGETDDFDGEGKSDILWRDTNTGATAIWFMNGTQISQTAILGVVPTNLAGQFRA